MRFSAKAVFVAALEATGAQIPHRDFAVFSSWLRGHLMFVCFLASSPTPDLPRLTKELRRLTRFADRARPLAQRFRAVGACR
jgi:hypothetical protein